MTARLSGEGAETERVMCACYGHEHIPALYRGVLYTPEPTPTEYCRECAELLKGEFEITERLYPPSPVEGETVPGAVEELADLIHTGTTDLSWANCVEIARNARDGGLLRDPEAEAVQRTTMLDEMYGHEARADAAEARLALAIEEREAFDSECLDAVIRARAAEAREATLRERIGKLCDEWSKGVPGVRTPIQLIAFIGHIKDALLDETEPTDA